MIFCPSDLHQCVQLGYNLKDAKDATRVAWFRIFEADTPSPICEGRSYDNHTCLILNPDSKLCCRVFSRRLDLSCTNHQLRMDGIPQRTKDAFMKCQDTSDKIVAQKVQLISTQILRRASRSSSGHWGHCLECISRAMDRIHVSMRDRWRGWKVFRQTSCRSHCSTLTGRSPAALSTLCWPHPFPLSTTLSCSALIKWKCFCISVVLNWFLLLPVSRLCAPPPVRSLAHSCKANSVQRQQGTPWPPLSHFLPLSTHLSLTHSFSVWAFLLLLFLPLVAHVPLSVLQSVPPLSLFHMCLSLFFPPHSPSQSILACPRYPQILLVVAARVSKIVFKDTCICVVVLFCVYLMLLMCTCICLLYYRVNVCSGLSGLQVWRW